MQTNDKLDDVQARKQIDTIVHLGAGRCGELDAYLALEPQRLLLVEADPELAETLQARATDHPQVQVVRAAVAGTSGPATFFRYNLPGAGSLRAASGLRQLFPGLKLVEEVPVEAVTPGKLLQPLELRVEDENQLVVDLPGEELPVLQALLREGQLHIFSHVQLYCGREPLYEGSEPAARVLQWLKEQGFDLQAEDDSLDPDRPCWTLERNALQMRNRELVAQLEALQGQLEQLIGSHDDQVKQAVQLKEQVRQLTAERDAQVESAAERNARIDQVTKERDDQKKLAAERQQRLEQLARTEDEQAKLVGERQAQVEQLKKARDEQSKLAAERQAQLEQLTKERDEKARWASTLKTQLAETTQAGDLEINKLKAALQEAKNRVAQLEAQLPEMEMRQQLLNEELSKAEGQIDLIKDLLLREPGL
jgi:FkbM family methyltransferase